MGWVWVSAAAAALALVCGWPGPGTRLRPAPAGRRPPPDRRRLLVALGAVGAAVVLAAAGWGWWALATAATAGGVGLVLSGALRDAAAARRSRALRGALPAVCDLLAVCLEAGLPPRTAADVVAGAVGGPLGDRLAELSARVRLGDDDAVAWAELGTEAELAGLAREVTRAVGSGVGLARSLRVLGRDARRDEAAAAEQRARRAGVRSVLPLMACFLPAFLLLGVVPIIGGIAWQLLS